MTSWIRMGVVHAYGLRGELKAVLDNESSTLRWVGLSVLLAAKDGTRSRTSRVASFRRTGGLGFMRLEGVDDRTAAEALEGFTLSVARSDLPPLDDDEVYLADLVGLAVELAGERVGSVTRVEIYPAANALVVRMGERDVEVPLHPPYVEEVDLEARVVKIAHLEDLVDERGR